MFKLENEINLKLKAWWEFEDQENPGIMITIKKNQEKIPDTDDLNRFWTDSEFITEREMALIDNSKYYGLAVPYHYVNFGSVPLGGVLGGNLNFIDKETTWNDHFINNIEEITSLKLNREGKWWQLIKEVTKKSVKKSKNHHHTSYFALSGITDIISMIYGMEPLLIDFIENPDGVKKAIDHLIPMWTGMFDEVTGMLSKSGNDGFIGWPGVWAPGTTFPLQEDLSYMLSTDMFEDFCLPIIDTLADKLEYPMYHLDGKGAVKFVDSLDKLKKIKAIQWVPGAGNEEISQWYELLNYIKSKKIALQVYAQDYEVDNLVKNVGAQGLLINVACQNVENAMRIIEKYMK